MYKKILIGFIFLFALIVYGFALKAVPGNITSNSPLITHFDENIPPFEVSGSRSNFAILLALNEQGTFNLTKDQADFAAPDTGYYNGKIYSFFPPGVAVLSLPLYKLGWHFNLSLAFAYFSISILAAISLCILFRISVEIFKLPIWVSLFVVILTGFGSHFLNFSISLYQQIPSAFLILLSFYSAWRYGQKTTFSWIWASIVWICYGLGSFITYPNLILQLPIMVYFLMYSIETREEGANFKLKINKIFILTSLIIILLGGLHMYYNQENFGQWKRFSNTLAQYDSHQEGKDLDSLEQKNVKAIADKKDQVSSIFQETNFINGIYYTLFDLDKSVLVHSPFFIISLLYVFFLQKKMSRELLLLYSILIVNIFVYSSFGDPWGGWSFGPRYQVPIIPLLAILFGYWLSTSKFSVYKKFTALLLFIYGSGVALLGALGTSVSPPRTQVITEGIYRVFLDRIDFIKSGQNGSFVFNTYLHETLSLPEFYLILLSFCVVLASITLFILPKFENNNIHQHEI